MDIRSRLLRAAAQVYAKTGYRGATTRRIAQEAGVNEITLFRHFGSKDVLIQEALRCGGGEAAVATLPAVSVDPERELREWCRTRYEHLYASRSLIRKMMGELEEHPEIVPIAKRGPSESTCELGAYLRRLVEQGIVPADANVRAAATMLMGALFAAAMGRDIMTEMYQTDVDDAVAEYVRLFLRAIGADVPAASPSAHGHAVRG